MNIVESFLGTVRGGPVVKDLIAKDEAAGEAMKESERATAIQAIESLARTESELRPHDAEVEAALEAKTKQIAALSAAQERVVRAHRARNAVRAKRSEKRSAAERTFAQTEPSETVAFLSTLDSCFQRVRGLATHDDTGELARAITAIHGARRAAQALIGAPLTRAVIREEIAKLATQIDAVLNSRFGKTVTLNAAGDHRMFERVEPRRGARVS